MVHPWSLESVAATSATNERLGVGSDKRACIPRRRRQTVRMVGESEPAEDARNGKSVSREHAIVGRALAAFLVRSERLRWNPEAVLAAASMPPAESLTEPEALALEALAAIEDALPVYIQEYFRLLVATSASLDEELRNRTLLSFVYAWAPEEDRHYRAIMAFLARLGDGAVRRAEEYLWRQRQMPFAFPTRSIPATLAYLAIQERATHNYYGGLARRLGRSALAAILRRMSVDEASHCSFFVGVLRGLAQIDAESVSRALDAVTQDFHMPLQDSLLNRRRRLAALGEWLPNYSPRTAMLQVAHQIGVRP